MIEASRITTTDNPYDPFDQFREWFMFDTTRGYNTCAYLARIARTSSDMTDEEQAEAIESAIDEIIQIDPFNIYKKIKRKVSDKNKIKEQAS